jgi:hypothetical protein
VVYPTRRRRHSDIDIAVTPHTTAWCALEPLPAEEVT